LDAAGNVSIGLAFLAGLVSFLSPCVFSLAPVYVGYLTSRSVTPEGVTIENRWDTFLHGVAFVLGFSVVFVTIGLVAAMAGQLLFSARTVLTRIGGVTVIVLGLHTMGLIHIPFLAYDTRKQQPPDPRLGYLSSALMGVFFSAGWSPCIGPVLGSVLMLALDSSSTLRGALLLSVYSLGMGLPFLAAAAGTGRAAEWLKKYRRFIRYMSIVSGALLIGIGALLLTDSLGILSNTSFVADFQLTLDDSVVNFWHGLTGGY
jgi:cytochrome c-type biogenesis protein